MKINFIRHISDDILKENQELKNTIIHTKLTLKSMLPSQLRLRRGNSQLHQIHQCRPSCPRHSPRHPQIVHQAHKHLNREKHLR